MQDVKYKLEISEQYKDSSDVRIHSVKTYKKLWKAKVRRLLILIFFGEYYHNQSDYNLVCIIYKIEGVEMKEMSRMIA